MKKNIIATILASTMVLGAPITLAAESEPFVISPGHSESEVVVDVPQITVNGEKLDLYKTNFFDCLYIENENVMVPLRAVTEKMGYKVEWNDERQTVTIANDEWEVVVEIGVDSYFGVTKIKGAVGMTAPQSYGVAPMLIKDTTFVPAKMFELMGYKFDVVGQCISFEKAGFDNENDSEYSKDTLIVSVVHGTEKSEIIELFKNNGLEVIYEMKNFDMYAVRLMNVLGEESLNKCIAELSKNKNVLSVSKDYIISIDDSTQIPNPFTSYKSIDEAKKVLSFEPVVPSYVPEGYEINDVSVMKDNFLQIMYADKDGDMLSYREAVGTDDISGDYNTYENIESAIINGFDVTLKGNGNTYNNVGWTDGDNVFSIFSNKGFSKNTIIEIVEKIK